MRYEFDEDTFARYIKISKKGFTASEFEELTGLSVATICRVQKKGGSRLPRLETVLAFATPLMLVLLCFSVR